MFRKIRLSTLHDIELHQCLECGIRGSISVITHRYAQANNQLIQSIENYDASQPTSFIICKDSANSLYGHAMSQPLPVNDFKWMAEREIVSFDVTTIPDDAENGHILEVDFKYPPKLHDLHSDYPLAPEKMVVTHDISLSTKIEKGTGIQTCQSRKVGT